MDIILLEKVANLGNIGDRVKVRAGYGRNFLVPRGKATMATAANIAIFERLRADLESKQAAELLAATQRGAKIAKMALQLSAKAGTEGKLFGSLGTADLSEACEAVGIVVKRSEIRLPDGPLRTLGEHKVALHLHTDVTVTIKVTVVAETDGGLAT